MSQVVSVISGKGGTGKTSLCAGISSCLAAEGSQVLCIDADVGLRNLDLSLGMSEEPILPFTAVMRGEYSLDSAAAHPEIPNLYMLTAPVTETAEELDEAQFSAMLDAARQRFDWILIDAPAGIGAGFRLATGSADQAIVVAGSDPASLRDAARATDVLLQQRSIPARLVVNRVSAALYRRMHATIDGWTASACRCSALSRRTAASRLPPLPGLRSRFTPERALRGPASTLRAVSAAGKCRF